MREVRRKKMLMSWSLRLIHRVEKRRVMKNKKKGQKMKIRIFLS